MTNPEDVAIIQNLMERVEALEKRMDAIEERCRESEMIQKDKDVSDRVRERIRNVMRQRASQNRP